MKELESGPYSALKTQVCSRGLGIKVRARAITKMISANQDLHFQSPYTYLFHGLSMNTMQRKSI